ncbi:hypothetical protein COU60_02615 [Candidatus Pacearchaeota archaeon CG10_big_fil_rev_8_21_14_0_10_34_76]|nr:MAG: hypothetical protein COU60_02615 [Candidatus Pacearchaeota archaeon CG10_big_fil_rev_8_21_14_0_10_34_76]
MTCQNFERLNELAQRIMLRRAKSIVNTLGNGLIFEDETLRIARNPYGCDSPNREELKILKKDGPEILFDSVYGEGQFSVSTYSPGKWEAQFRVLYAESLERRAGSEFPQKKMKFPRRAG